MRQAQTVVDDFGIASDEVVIRRIAEQVCRWRAQRRQIESYQFAAALDRADVGYVRAVMRAGVEGIDGAEVFEASAF